MVFKNGVNGDVLDCFYRVGTKVINDLNIYLLWVLDLWGFKWTFLFLLGVNTETYLFILTLSKLQVNMLWALLMYFMDSHFNGKLKA